MKWKRLSDLTENEQRESVKPGTDIREDPQKHSELEEKQNMCTVIKWQIMTGTLIGTQTFSRTCTLVRKEEVHIL